MTHQLIGGHVANDREQMGGFLRHAFPLDVGSFHEVVESLDAAERESARRKAEMPVNP